MSEQTVIGKDLFCALISARGKLTKQDLAMLLDEVTRQNFHLNFGE